MFKNKVTFKNHVEVNKNCSSNLLLVSLCVKFAVVLNSTWLLLLPNFCIFGSLLNISFFSSSSHCETSWEVHAPKEYAAQCFHLVLVLLIKYLRQCQLFQRNEIHFGNLTLAAWEFPKKIFYKHCQCLLKFMYLPSSRFALQRTRREIG